MAPWYARMEERLGVAPWAVEPNANNAVLRDGCEKLGLHWKTVPRNVRGCWNIGYCGLGCTTNAKQSMLVTTIPTALDHGMSLLRHARVDKQTGSAHVWTPVPNAHNVCRRILENKKNKNSPHMRTSNL